MRGVNKNCEGNNPEMKQNIQDDEESDGLSDGEQTSQNDEMDEVDPH